jgi:hypothetical protein
MRGEANLERRYRRLLAFYPRRFRREHREEMLEVLMAGAAPGQQRPGLVASADLIGNALWMRVWRVELPRQRQNAGIWIWVRTLVAIWLVTLTAMFCGNGHWWGLALLAPAALHVFLAYHLARPAIKREREQGWPHPGPPRPAGQ